MPNENDNKLVTLADLAEAYTALYNRDVMTSEDKTKLDVIEAGAQVNTITGVKGNAESSYRTGDVNLTPADIGAVAKAGDTMTGNLIIQTSYDPAILYARADGTLRGYTLTNDDNRYIVIQKHLNDDNVDSYYFPIVNSGSSIGYDVLTTKSPVTVAQGGTGTTDAFSALKNLFDVGYNTATNYPDKPGVYLIAGQPIFSNMTPDNSYGVLVIFKAFYSMHIFLDGATNLYFGFSGEPFGEPTTWNRANKSAMPRPY